VPLICTGCAVTIPPGHAGVLVTPSGVQPQVVEEGLAWIGPLSHIDVYDLRGQERTEDLPAVAADGAPVIARASIVTYSIVHRELPALEREIGPQYYEVIIQPIVRASVRQVIAGYRSDQLTPDGIRKAQVEITALIAARAQPFHLVVASVDLRTLAFMLSDHSYRIVIDAATEEQKALTEPQLLALARERAEEWRVSGRAIAKAHALVAPDLSQQVLSDSAARAWTSLVTAPSTTVIIPAAGPPVRAEITP
jgi:regulator of protease activity HflC (stomatin/prohibitin superfamily)